jgi:hypothetical protein
MLTPVEIWTRLGGGGNTPPKLGRYTGAAVVIGGARCVWEDLGHVSGLAGARIAVNDIAMHYAGRLDHLVTLHPEYVDAWLCIREGHCLGEGARPRVHSHRGAPRVDDVWPGAIVGGTSGLAAAYVALMLGYAPVILAGVPMDGSGHYFDPPYRGTPELTEGHVDETWAQALDIFAGRVTSLSGRTRAWLGAPDFMTRAA